MKKVGNPNIPTTVSTIKCFRYYGYGHIALNHPNKMVTFTKQRKVEEVVNDSSEEGEDQDAYD